MSNCSNLSQEKKRLSLFSPAKVNLFFRVLKKRNDGYHEIASLSQTVSLFDEIQISLEERDSFICNDPYLPKDSSNLILKSLNLFRKKTGWSGCVQICLNKKIPIEAGLGGGSGNAATTLWGLNQLTGMGIEEKELASWVSEFSSDAPLFFSRGTAYCRGRGEVFNDVPDFNLDKFWIVKPKIGLSTPLVYQNCILDQFPERDPDAFLQRAQKGSLEMFNDLEIPAFSLLPDLENLKNRLKEAGFEKVTMTGSGTAMLCFSQEQAPLDWMKNNPDLNCFFVQPINRQHGCWYEFPKV